MKITNYWLTTDDYGVGTSTQTFLSKDKRDSAFSEWLLVTLSPNGISLIKRLEAGESPVSVYVDYATGRSIKDFAWVGEQELELDPDSPAGKEVAALNRVAQEARTFLIDSSAAGWPLENALKALDAAQKGEPQTGPLPFTVVASCSCNHENRIVHHVSATDATAAKAAFLDDAANGAGLSAEPGDLDIIAIFPGHLMDSNWE